VLVVEVDAIHTESFQRSCTGFLHVCGVASDHHLAIFSLDSKVGREEDLVSSPSVLEPLSDQLLVSVGAVDIAGVSECYSQVGSASEDFARGGVVMTAERAVSE
jgi:hypothetical protein